MATMLLDHLKATEGEWLRVLDITNRFEFLQDTLFHVDIDTQLSLLTHAIENDEVWKSRTESPSSLKFDIIKSNWRNVDPQEVEDQLRNEYPDLQWDELLAIQTVIEDDAVTSYAQLYSRLTEVLPQYTDAKKVSSAGLFAERGSKTGDPGSAPHDEAAGSKYDPRGG